MSEVIVRRKKTSDKDMKEFFADYSNAKGRQKVIISKTLGRQLTAEEEQEYKDLALFLQCIDGLVDSLEPLVSKIIREYYIDHNTLFNISVDVNYCYEHVSYLKNIGCDNIRKILAGEEVIQNEQSIKLLELIKETVNVRSTTQRNR